MFSSLSGFWFVQFVYGLSIAQNLWPIIIYCLN